MMHCQNKGVFHSIFWNFLIIITNGMHLLNLDTDSTSHLELPNTENVSLSKGYAKLYLHYPYI